MAKIPPPSANKRNNKNDKNIIWRITCKFYERISTFMYMKRGGLRARYYSVILKECGSDLTINGKPSIWCAEKIHIGNHVTINHGVQIAPRGEVYIGNYVTMSRGSQITAGQLSLEKWMDEQNTTHSHVDRPVYIADGCWLCINSIVLPGVSIRGKGVVVAAGAVVANDINEDYVVVGGIPAKIIRYLNNKD